MNTVHIKKAVLLILFSAVLACAASAQNIPPAKSDAAQTERESVSSQQNAYIKAAPVAPFNDQIIFSIYAKLGPFTPAERAERLESIIQRLSEDHDFSPDKMTFVTHGTMIDIVYNDTIVMSVSDGDAEYFDKSKDDIAEYYKEHIAGAIKQHRLDTELKSILIRVGLALLILGAFFFSIKYLNRLHEVVRRKVVSLRGNLIKNVKIKSYSLLDEDRCIAAVLFIVKIFKYLAILTILYFAVTLLFSVFPETRGLAGTLWGYILTPFLEIVFAVRDYLPKAVTIAVVVTIFRYLEKGIKFFACEIEKGSLTIKGFYPDWAMPTYNIFRTLLYVFMFIVIFQYLPYSDSKIFQGVSVFIGVLISLGSTALIGNLISGMVLTYMRPFRVGDFIMIGDTLGTVKEKAPFAIRIETTKNEEVIIPNSNIMSARTINYSMTARESRLILHTTVTFGYDAPWRQVHELLLLAAARTPYVLADPPPFILQRALDNSFAEYQINVYVTEEKKMPRIYSKLYENVQDAFNEAGIDMTNPVYQSFRGENSIRITQ